MQPYKNIGQDLEYNQLYKIVMVGDAGVGKTHLLNKYTKGTVTRSPVPTIGVEFATKTITLQNGEKVKAQIWDTAGQEQYRSITMAHYRRAVGALIVYDITKQKTFNNVRRWLDNVREYAEPDCVIMLVGNKADLPDRAVRRQDAKNVADQNGLLFQEISAKQSNSINHLFDRLLEKINAVKKDAFDNYNPSIDLRKRRPEEKPCQC